MRYPKELLKGTTPLIVLEVLNSKQVCGFDLVQAIRERSQNALELPEGTIYPLLYRLEGKGLIQGIWKSQDGRRAERIYRLTERGKKYLHEQKAIWSKFASALRFFTGGVKK